MKSPKRAMGSTQPAPHGAPRPPRRPCTCSAAGVFAHAPASPLWLVLPAPLQASLRLLCSPSAKPTIPTGQEHRLTPDHRLTPWVDTIPTRQEHRLALDLTFRPPSCPPPLRREPPLLACALALSSSPHLLPVLGDMPSTLPGRALPLVPIPKPQSAGQGSPAQQQPALVFPQEQLPEWARQGLGGGLMRSCIAMLTAKRCSQVRGGGVEGGAGRLRTHVVGRGVVCMHVHVHVQA